MLNKLSPFLSNLSLLDLLHYGKSGFSLLFAGLGIYFAYKGLNIWRDQLKGTDKYNLAKAIIIGLYEIKNLFKTINNNLLFNANINLDNARAYFVHLDYIQEKLTVKRSDIQYALLQLNIIYKANFDQEITDVFHFIDEFNRLSPSLRLQNAENNTEAFNFFFKNDNWSQLDNAINTAISRLQSFLNN